jgi:hypothetical protein
MKARAPAPAPLLEAALTPTLLLEQALTPTPLPKGRPEGRPSLDGLWGEGRTGGAAHPFALGEKVARRAG